jgi:hypothetical protein
MGDGGLNWNCGGYSTVLRSSNIRTYNLSLSTPLPNLKQRKCVPTTEINWLPALRVSCRIKQSEGVSITFPNALYAISRASLALIAIYCRHKSIVAKLIALHISHNTEDKLFSLYFIKYPQCINLHTFIMVQIGYHGTSLYVNT